MVAADPDPSDNPESEPAKRNGPTEPDPIRVVVADSEAIYRAGMRNIFAPEPDIQVVSEVDSIPSLRSAIESAPSDVVILEGNLIGLAADEIPELVRRAPDAGIIVAVADADEPDKVELYRRGVRGVIARSISPDLLVKSVRKIAAGETWIDNQAVADVIEALQEHTADLTSPRTRQISPKELVIMKCITEGKKNKEIAQQLETTEQMIKNRLSKIYKKLGVSDRLALAIYCQRHPLLKDASDPGVKTIASNANGSDNK